MCNDLQRVYRDDELCLWHSGKGFVGEATEGNGDPNVIG